MPVRVSWESSFLAVLRAPRKMPVRVSWESSFLAVLRAPRKMQVRVSWESSFLAVLRAPPRYAAKSHLGIVLHCGTAPPPHIAMIVSHRNNIEHDVVCFRVCSLAQHSNMENVVIHMTLCRRLHRQYIRCHHAYITFAQADRSHRYHQRWYNVARCAQWWYRKLTPTLRLQLLPTWCTYNIGDSYINRYIWTHTCVRSVSCVVPRSRLHRLYRSIVDAAFELPSTPCT